MSSDSTLLAACVALSVLVAWRVPVRAPAFRVPTGSLLAGSLLDGSIELRINRAGREPCSTPLTRLVRRAHQSLPRRYQRHLAAAAHLLSRSGLRGRTAKHAIAVAVLAALTASPAAALMVLALAAVGASVSARRRLRREAMAKAGAVPDFIDLVRLCLECGCTTPQALAVLGAQMDGPLQADVRAVARAIDDGGGLANALTLLSTRVGAPVRPLCSALLSGERYGLPSAQILDTLGAEARAARRQAAERRARRLPVTLLFPLVTCTLPAFALLTVVPLLVSGLQTVRW